MYTSAFKASTGRCLCSSPPPLPHSLIHPPNSHTRRTPELQLIGMACGACSRLPPGSQSSQRVDSQLARWLDRTGADATTGLRLLEAGGFLNTQDLGSARLSVSAAGI